MDITPEYIKMCRLATEIQEPRSSGEVPLEHGDYLFLDGQVVLYLAEGEELAFQYENRDRLVIMEGWNDENSHERKIDHPVVWIPRQDQLQELINKEYVEPSAMINDLLRWVHQEDMYLEEIFHGSESMEQLWLTFLMHQNYAKVWHGGEWK